MASGVVKETLGMVPAHAGAVTDTPAAQPKKQHVVSRVVLKEWTVGGRLRELNIAWPGARWRWSTPAGSGYVPRFVRVDAAKVEARWKKVEDRLPAALAELRQGGPVRPGTETEDAVIACLAMHWARSKAVRDTSDRIYAEQRRLSMDRLAQLPGALDWAHFAATGVHAAGPEARRLANERLHTGPPEIVSGARFAERVIDFYEEALDWYGRQHLQIYDIPADAPDLIVSDAPVLTPASAGTGLSPLSGVPLRKASSVAMPLGPRLAVSLNPVPERVTVTREHAEELNAMQCRAAAEFLYRRPTADDGPALGPGPR